ncbi:MAG: hypothetical protein HQL69_23470 [Magnetococcales bacterium]|nr:hypothetical protein [Magnetococcales bacterium]
MWGQIQTPKPGQLVVITMLTSFCLFAPNDGYGANLGSLPNLPSPSDGGTTTIVNAAEGLLPEADFPADDAPDLGSGAVLSVNIKAAVNAAAALQGKETQIQEVGAIDAETIEGAMVSVQAGSLFNTGAQIGGDQSSSTERVGTIKVRGTVINSAISVITADESGLTPEIASMAVGSGSKSNVDVGTIHADGSVTNDMISVLIGKVSSTSIGERSQSSVDVGSMNGSSNSKLGVTTGTLDSAAIGKWSSSTIDVGAISDSKNVVESVTVADVTAAAVGEKSSAKVRIGSMDHINRGLVGIGVGEIITSSGGERDSAATNIGVDSHVNDLTQAILIGSVTTQASSSSSTAITTIGKISNVTTARQLIMVGQVTTSASGDGTLAKTVIGEVEGVDTVDENIVVGIVTTSSVGHDSRSITKVGAVLGGGQVHDTIVTGLITNHAEAVSSNALIEIGNVSSGVTGDVDTTIIIGDVTNTVSASNGAQSRIRVGNVYEQDGGHSSINIAAGALNSTVAAAIDGKSGIMLGNIKQSSGGTTMVAAGDLTAVTAACQGAACDMELLTGGTCISIGNIGMDCNSQALDDLLGQILKFLLGLVHDASDELKAAAGEFTKLAGRNADRTAALIGLEPVSLQIKLATANPGLVNTNVMKSAISSLQNTALRDPDLVGNDTVEDAFNAIKSIAVKSTETIDTGLGISIPKYNMDPGVVNAAVSSLSNIANSATGFIKDSGLGQEAFDTLRSVAASGNSASSAASGAVSNLSGSGDYHLPDSGSGSGSGGDDPPDPTDLL